MPETLESVLAQTYSHWELLLIDDGATDGSTRIAADYAAHYPQNIRIFEHAGHANLGVTRTRNFGAEHAGGEFLAFLDADDVWLPGKLEMQVAAMQANPDAGLVCGPSEYWHDWDANAEERNHVPPVAPGGRLYFPPELLAASYPFGTFGAPCPSSFLLRRTAFDRIGGFVEDFRPSTYQLYEDAAFLTKAYLNVPVYVTEQHTDRYRCHATSIWHRTKRTTRDEAERRFYFHWLRGYLHQQRMTSPEILRAVRRVAWPYWLPLPSRVTHLLRRIGNRLSR